MVNLIPQHAKKTVALEYYVRVVTVWLWLISAALMIVGVLLFPVGLMVKLQLGAIESAYAEAESSSSAQQVLVKTVLDANVLAQELVRVNLRQNVWDDVALIYNLMPDGVTITSITLAREGDVVKKITVTGEAATRSDLALARDLLKGNGRFSAVALPLSNLAKDVDIPYSVTLDVMQPK
jgi:hypothetical protein